MTQRTDMTMEKQDRPLMEKDSWFHFDATIMKETQGKCDNCNGKGWIPLKILGGSKLWCWKCSPKDNSPISGIKWDNEP